MTVVRALAIAMLACGCSRTGPGQELVVLAASSLTEAFEDIEIAFEAEHPGVAVSCSFAGSQALRVQVEQGAPADVIAVADPKQMQALASDQHVLDPGAFATGNLVVVVPGDAKDAIEDLSELPEARRIVLGAPGVPVGDYARKLLERADARFGPGFRDRVLANVVSEEANVRLVLGKVALGEADAAIVYRSDALASDEVRAIEVPRDLDVIARYEIAVVARSQHAELARAFVAFVEGEKAREILEQRGFGPGAD